MRITCIIRRRHRGHAEKLVVVAAGAVVGKYGGTSAERALYRAFNLTKGFDFGPPRLPKAPFDEKGWEGLQGDLAALGFWDGLRPPASGA